MTVASTLVQSVVVARGTTHPSHQGGPVNATSLTIAGIFLLVILAVVAFNYSRRKR